jgi:hypothetical protein
MEWGYNTATTGTAKNACSDISQANYRTRPLSSCTMTWATVRYCIRSCTLQSRAARLRNEYEELAMQLSGQSHNRKQVHMSMPGGTIQLSLNFSLTLRMSMESSSFALIATVHLCLKSLWLSTKRARRTMRATGMPCCVLCSDPRKRSGSLKNRSGLTNRLATDSSIGCT